jgi:hypothetical protein
MAGHAIGPFSAAAAYLNDRSSCPGALVEGTGSCIAGNDREPALGMTVCPDMPLGLPFALRVLEEQTTL